jgi:outer membrane protein TolC
MANRKGVFIGAYVPSELKKALQQRATSEHRTLSQEITRILEEAVKGPRLPPNFIGGYGQTLQNLFSFDTRQIVVGVTVQLPLRNRTAEANLAFAQIEREQLAASTRSQEQGIEVEVRNAVQAVETARRRVLAARSARENAELQLAGERRLYQVGRSTTFLLFQRENQLVNARNQELRAETDYNKALAELQRATSTTLRINNVVIDSPIGR